MVIDELLEVLPQPARPVDTGSEEGWLRVTRRLGTRLPVDYVYFVKNYGTGEINGYLSVLNPFSHNRFLNLIATMPSILSGLRALRRVDSSSVPYPLYFEPGGLLPWGLTDNGEYLCWQTTELEDLWPVILLSPGDGVFDRYELCMAQVLARLLTGRLTSQVLPAEIFRDSPTFTPSGRPA